ncbi:MAG: substrate-binding domain-containing protein [Candidatus Sumerlaeota bacterium]|nr:substrate-binding domain-containing protein [Candidatus Sumerlaeota bacterium]
MHKIIQPAIALMIVCVLCACDRSANNAPQSQSGKPEAGAGKASATAAKSAKSDQLYIEVSALGGLDYFFDHKLGMKMAGEALGVKTEYLGPSTYDMAAMISTLEQTLAKKPCGLVVVGFEPSLTAVVDKAVAAGIPVVTVDADLPDSKRVAFVGTGNFQAGYQGGRKLGELIGSKGQVAIMTKPGQSNLDQRVAGYRKALAEFPGVTVLSPDTDTQSNPNVAAQAAATLLQKYPDLAAIACVEAAGGMGAATAVREAKKAGKIKVIAMDRGNDVLEQIKEGTISASVAQQTALMPFYATQILYNLKNNPIPITNDNAKAGITGTPGVVDTGVIIVDKSNCEFFMRK